MLTILSGGGIISMSAETMILPAIPDFIKGLGISYWDSLWILAESKPDTLITEQFNILLSAFAAPSLKIQDLRINTF